MGSMTDLNRLGAQQSASYARPMIVTDNAYVTYKVFAGGKPVGGQNKILGQRGDTFNEVHALRGVSFTAAEGESIGVVGHNGSGKSTLFRAMAGLIPTTQGSIRAADRPVLLGVNAALMPELSGENNIKLGLLAMGFTAEEAASQVNEIADFAELNEFISYPMRTYSSGMGARLRFAIASARPHSILLLDEALAVGDRRFRMKSEARIRNLRDAAGLVMIVSHSPSSLRETCERGLWVHKGELRADGPIKDVIAEYTQWAKDPMSVGVGASAEAQAAAARRKRVAARIAKKAAAAASADAVLSVQGADNVIAPSTAPGAANVDAESIVPSTDSLPAGSRLDTQALALTPATETIKVPRTTTAIQVPSTISPRDAARRERFREAAHKRGRRRTRAILLSCAAVVVAVGAGAAITLVTLQSDRTEISELREAARHTPAPSLAPVMPVVNAFVAPPTAACATEDSVVDILLGWDTVGVEAVTLTSVGDDGIPVPVGETFASNAEAQPAQFTCYNAAQSFTLTARSEGGQQITATATIARELAPVEFVPDVVEPVEELPVEPSPVVDPPVEVAPEPQITEEPTPPSPLPSPTPEEPDPTPDPTPDEPPAVEVPSPEPTIT